LELKTLLFPSRRLLMQTALLLASEKGDCGQTLSPNGGDVMV